jgi:hypothetical protein
MSIHGPEDGTSRIRSTQSTNVLIVALPVQSDANDVSRFTARIHQRQRKLSSYNNNVWDPLFLVP